jgi:autotransporter-associated beta strand protein
MVLRKRTVGSLVATAISLSVSQAMAANITIASGTTTTISALPPAADTYQFTAKGFSGNGTMLFNGAFTLPNSITFNAGVTGTIDTGSFNDVLSGVLSGAGSLIKQGTGALTLRGVNTYSGGTTLAAGTLAVGNSSALGTGALTITGGTLLGRADLTLANPLVFGSDATLQATTNTTLTVGDGGWNFASGNANLTFGSVGTAGTVVWNYGSGTRSITGPGPNLTIAGGTLKAGTADLGGFLLPGSSSLNVNAAATLDLGGFSASLPAALSGSGRITSSSGAPTLTVNGGIFDGTIDSALALNAFGNTTLTGANTYSGGTTINGGASLSVGNGGAGGSIVGNVLNNGTLVVAQTSDLVLGGVISGSGALKKSGSGMLTLNGANTYGGGTTLAAGTLAVGNSAALGTGILTINGGTLLGTADVTLSNRLIFGSNATLLAKAGTTMNVGSGGWGSANQTSITVGSVNATGTVVLNGSSGAPDADIYIAGGTLKAMDSQLGAVLPRVFSLNVNAGATLDLGGFDASLPAHLSGSGRVTTTSGAPTLTVSGSSFAGTIDGALALNVSGTLLGTNILNATTMLTGANTYSGGTTIYGRASLVLGNGLAGGSIVGNVLNNGTLAVAQTSDLVLGGVISGSGALSKQGSGTLTLNGANTYGGGTTLAGGTLAVGNSSALGTGALIIDGGTLLGTADATLLNSLNFGSAATLQAKAGTTMNVGGGGWVTGSGANITIGSGGATGTVVWNSGGVVGISYQGGAWNIAGGTLKAGTGDLARYLLHYASSLTVNSGATLDLGGFDAYLTAALSGSGRITTTSGAPMLELQGSSFAGTIDGAVFVNAYGNTTLTGANTYSGGTFINGGATLFLGNGGAGGSIVGNVYNFGTLSVAQTSDLVLGGVISGSGALKKSGSGTLTLNGANTYSGGTVINGGTLQLGNGGIGGSIVGDVQNAGTLKVNQSSDLVLGGVISGNGALAKAGSGTLTLTGANTYSGGTTITSGTVQIGDGGTSGSIVGDVVNDGVLIFNRSDAMSFAGAISGNGKLLKQGTGSLTLAGLSNAAGDVDVQAGSLQIQNALAVAGAFTNIGSVGVTGSLSVGGSLDNSGAIALAGGTITGAGALANDNLLSGFGTIGGTGGFVNYGQVAHGGGALILSNTGANANNGNWEVLAGAPLVLSGATLTNAGVLNLGGGLVSGGGTLVNSALGTVGGRGTITANFSNDGLLALTGGAMNITRAFTNTGLIQLGSATANLLGGAVTNKGGIAGFGNVGSAVANSGRIEAVDGTLVLGGSLTNTAAGLIAATGTSQVVVTQGLAANAGLISLAGGTFDNNNHALSNSGQISGYGNLRASSLGNSGSMSFTGGNTTVNGNVTNNAGATLHVSYNPATFTGNVVNNGTIKTTATTTTFTGSFTNNGAFISDPATQIFQDLTLGTQATLQGGVGDVFVVNGNMVNNSQANTTFDLSQAKLMFSGGAHGLTWSATNFGAVRSGYNNNFAIGTFELAAGGSLSLTGTLNVPGANALYVHEFVLDGGLVQIGSIQSNGLNIYYDPTDAANGYLGGRTYALAGSGNLMAVPAVAAVPEPRAYSMMLAGLALMGFIARRRRRKAD